MVFSSLAFIFVFLPLVLGIYYFFNIVIKDMKIRRRCKNVYLLIMSLLFYSFGSLYYLLLLLGSILGNYLFTILINRFKEKKGISKTFLVLSLVFNIGLLFFFKYFNMTIGLIELMTHTSFGLAKIALPIGISFFTFQAISYVVDVYLGKVECQKNLFTVALYISLFPQLIAGPIVQYKDVENQLNEREETLDKFADGVRRFIVGLGKKVLIASILGEVADYVFGLNPVLFGTSLAWLGLICYTIEIYFDFSAYSDMAIGLGKMVGFEFLENFNTPYLSSSITDFWRRWHISLGSWFREYVYIPLGGNRKGKFRTVLNLFIVFVLTGIWHGANLTFFLWGTIFGILIVIERLGFSKILDELKGINVIFTVFIVMLLWVLFRADDLEHALAYYTTLFVDTSEIITNVNQTMSIIRWTALIMGILLAAPIPLLTSFLKRKEWFNSLLNSTAFVIIKDVALMAIFVTSVYFLVSGSYNPFIYFQF